jgi:hypothetical protein
MASSPIPAMREYKPGGVISILRDDIVNRRVDQGADLMGRWAFHSLKRTTGRNITFVTAYQPCMGSPSKDGRMTVINQQYSLLLKEKRHKPEKS